MTEVGAAKLKEQSHEADLRQGDKVAVQTLQSGTREGGRCRTGVLGEGKVRNRTRKCEPSFFFQDGQGSMTAFRTISQLGYYVNVYLCYLKRFLLTFHRHHVILRDQNQHIFPHNLPEGPRTGPRAECTHGTGAPKVQRPFCFQPPPRSREGGTS